MSDVGVVERASPVLFPGGGVAIVAIGRAIGRAKWVWDMDGKGRELDGAELVADAHR